jgi:hypothetical protein
MSVQAKDAKLLNVYKDGAAYVLCVLEPTKRYMARCVTVNGSVWSYPPDCELEHVGGPECWAEIVKPALPDA